MRKLRKLTYIEALKLNHVLVQNGHRHTLQNFDASNYRITDTDKGKQLYIENYDGEGNWTWDKTSYGDKL